MIKGIGVDLISISRIEKLVKVDLVQFIQLFTENEQRLAEESDNRTRFLAGRFACKEAVFKCLDISMNTKYLSQIETLKTPNGQPFISLSDDMAQIAKEKEIFSWKVSISYDAGLAIAYVIAE